MGTYLAKPNNEKVQEEGENANIRFAATSMQGWRINQEDSHNCLIDFGEGCSMFGVYDGHGGSEVSSYIALNFPEFLRTNKLLKREDIMASLQQLFIAFDNTLREDETVKVLTAMKAESEGESKKGNGASAEDAEEKERKERDTLLEEAIALSKEAKISLAEIITEYGLCRNILIERESKRTKRSLDQSSPQIVKKARKLGEEDDDEEGEVDGKDETVENGNHKNGEEKDGKESIKQSEDHQSKDKVGNNGETKHIPEKAADRKEVEEAESGIGTEKGKLTPPQEEHMDQVCAVSAAQVSSSSVQIVAEGSEDDDEDADDEDYKVDEESADSDAEDGSGSEDEEAAAEDEEEEENDEDCYDMLLNNSGEANKAGFDSGSTACVLFVFQDRIVVANIGDSRAVLCRAGKAIELSADHKPEDAKERERIRAAGGTVSRDGRVNGGLNLSRAFGDHYYKQVSELPSQDQMITALPDVTVTDRCDGQDEFLIVACDGIWNSMSSQEACDFVAERINSKSLKQIGAEICDHCCAEDTSGDGSGCDNETILIIDLNKAKRTMISPGEETSAASTTEQQNTGSE